MTRNSLEACRDLAECRSVTSPTERKEEEGAKALLTWMIDVLPSSNSEAPKLVNTKWWPVWRGPRAGWCSPGWDFFYGAMTKISISPHCRLACECSLRNRRRRPQSEGTNTATTELLLYCSYRGDLRPKFWLSTLKPKSSCLLASICRLDGDGEKCPNGLAIDR
jgi:hypothetical protein